MGLAKILLTGFEPFANAPVNSSWQAVKAAKKMQSAISHHISIALMPVAFIPAHQLIFHLLEQYRPDILLMCGLAKNGALKMERLAKKANQLAMVKGDAVLTGCWPWQKTLRQLKLNKIKLSLSEDAGQFVCESAYWSALRFRQLYGYPKRIAFLHMPPLSATWTIRRLAETILQILKIGVSDIKTRSGYQSYPLLYVRSNRLIR